MRWLHVSIDGFMAEWDWIILREFQILFFISSTQNKYSIKKSIPQTLYNPYTGA